jgi:UDP-N-acetylmuramate--alanine ligase
MPDKNHIHLIGIGGTGLSAIAKVLLEQGHHVSGSDMHTSAQTESIAASGAVVFIGHDAAHIAGADWIIQSSAVPDTNPEVMAARKSGIPVFKRAQMLSQIIREKHCLAVAGTHGKTTTTAMLAWVLTALDNDPSYIIGSVAKNLGSNAHAGKGEYFVIEADEYDNMFLGLSPHLAIVTNLQHDHPDCFPTLHDYREAFLKFIHNIQPGGFLLVCADDPHAMGLLPDVAASVLTATYGFSEQADYRITPSQNNVTDSYTFDIIHKGSFLLQVNLPMPGTHNFLNAAAVIAAVQLLGADVQTASEALSEFTGTSRRFDTKAVIDGITLMDDYAHHPTEIKATLQAARQKFSGGRIWAVWQPHTYSRTLALLNDFAEAFTDADEVLVTSVYAARERNDDFSETWLASQIHHPRVHYTPAFEDVVNMLLDNLSSGDVVIVCSAGNAIAINAMLEQQLRQRTTQSRTKESA